MLVGRGPGLPSDSACWYTWPVRIWPPDAPHLPRSRRPARQRGRRARAATFQAGNQRQPRPADTQDWHPILPQPRWQAQRHRPLLCSFGAGAPAARRAGGMGTASAACADAAAQARRSHAVGGRPAVGAAYAGGPRPARAAGRWPLACARLHPNCCAWSHMWLYRAARTHRPVCLPARSWSCLPTPAWAPRAWCLQRRPPPACPPARPRPPAPCPGPCARTARQAARQRRVRGPALCLAARVQHECSSASAPPGRPAIY